ncbi:MAG: type II toxin-antitoxin system RelE/ParE family toxin [Gammaproteobacteria bacterium]|nr:type II toxin-antitoxin system RelE/ParE family toxin [Gammaproteobacteria bacterium]MDH5630013.1 type II toxin-antitoxin system RelE/ParE family toxin [Gammaproteobacteria bacterium]
MNIKISKEASNDLVSIGRYTQKEWGIEQRRKYLSEIHKKFSFLLENPQISPLRSEFNPPVYIHHHKKHLIVYIVEVSSILIIRVLHESMDIDEAIGDSTLEDQEDLQAISKRVNEPEISYEELRTELKIHGKI